MRLLAGAGMAGDGVAGPADVAWSRDRGRPVAGGDAARSCAVPTGSRVSIPADRLQAHAAAVSAGGRRNGSICSHRLRLGACLADDMGLGKTIQVLSLLLVLKREAGEESGSR